jgi:hypothetical protein
MGIMCEKCNQCATFVAMFDSYLSIVDIIMPFHHFWLSCPKINRKKCQIQNKENKMIIYANFCEKDLLSEG